MTRRQRIALAVAGGLAAAFLLALLVAAALVSDDPDEELLADLTTTTASTTVPEETTTTAALDLPTTTAPPATTTTTRSATPTTATRPKPVVDGQGAVLRPPAAPASRSMRDDDCTTLADPGWAPVCDRITPDLLWLTESRPASGGNTGHRALVFRREGGDRWAVALETRDDDGSRFTGVTVRVEDLSGDGAKEAAFGFRRTGSTRVLALDVVDSPGTVVVHRESPDGRGRVSPGQLDVWEAVGTAYDHLAIRFVDGAWRIVATERVERAAVPPSHF